MTIAPLPDTATLSFKDWMAHIQAQVELSLDSILPSAEVTPARLHSAMRYAAMDGGKRVRPLLTFAAAQACADNLSPQALAQVACSVELIHAYSLVHDDMPCMDDDTLRRGKPTCHIQYDQATALLVGDALQTQAFDCLSDAQLPFPAQQQLEMIRVLAHASGSAGMCGGQAIDCESVGLTLHLPQLQQMHKMKTGALIRAAVLLGAHAAQAKEATLHHLDIYAQKIGLAFQVIDDVLDAEADSATLGKTAGKDAANNKPTYVSLLGLDEAKQWAQTLLQQAHEALEQTHQPCLRLHQLADFIVMRTY